MSKFIFKSYYLPLIFVIIIVISVLLVIRSGNRDPGAYLYNKHCENCHQDQGEGLKALIPPLDGSDWIKNNQDTLACIIRHGINGPMTVNGKFYDEKMPANEKLTDGQILNIINYINSTWSNDYGRYTLREVQQHLKTCAH